MPNTRLNTELVASAASSLNCQKYFDTSLHDANQILVCRLLRGVHVFCYEGIYIHCHHKLLKIIIMKGVTERGIHYTSSSSYTETIQRTIKFMTSLSKNLS